MSILIQLLFLESFVKWTAFRQKLIYFSGEGLQYFANEFRVCYVAGTTWKPFCIPLVFHYTSYLSFVYMHKVHTNPAWLSQAVK